MRRRRQSQLRRCSCARAGSSLEAHSVASATRRPSVNTCETSLKSRPRAAEAGATRTYGSEMGVQLSCEEEGRVGVEEEEEEE